MTRIAVHLRRIAVSDFRTSEATMFAALPANVRETLKGSDAVCFVSRSGNQIVFVYRQVVCGITRGGGRQMLTASVRLRLSHGTWNPLLLQNYANSVGLKLVGLPRFEEHFAARKAS